jgi:hypothetical protein
MTGYRPPGDGEADPTRFAGEEVDDAVPPEVTTATIGISRA